MRKKVKKFGNSFMLLLSPEEREVYNIEKGDVLDIEIKEVIKKENLKDFHKK